MIAEVWGRGCRRRVALREVPLVVLQRIRERDGAGCALCRRLGLTPPPSEPLELDHKQPLSEGGDSHWSNLQFLCRYHNRSRGNRPSDPQGLPTWLGELSRQRHLSAHVEACLARGDLWAPASRWHAAQIEALLRNEGVAS